ncbi:outer membrane protein OmpK, partial [Escherichia fergusonii]
RYTDQTYYTGDNGYVMGWVAGYSFMLGSEKFTLTNWNEYEFDRDESYAAGNGGKDGINGAVAFWWNATPHFTAGIQYRYADNKLGEAFLQDGIIYSVKYIF